MAKFDRDARTFETRITFIRDIFTNKYEPIEIMAHCIQYKLDNDAVKRVLSGEQKLHNIVETSGGAVVVEETCTGTRYFERLVDETKETVEEQIEALADRYMGINCACFTPNTERIDDIIRLAKEYKVDGIIDVNLKFCNLYDTEGYFVERALKEAGIPVLGIETDYTDSDAQQLRTRVSAFIEMLNA